MRSEIIPQDQMASGLLRRPQYNPETIENAVRLWADAKTDPDSGRREDLLRDKARALTGDGEHALTGEPVATGFFAFTRKHPANVTAEDVKAWRDHLEGHGLSASTIYAKVSRLSSFYRWLLADPDLSQMVHRNPVNVARPKAPQAYQSESTQALTDREARALVNTVRAEAEDSVVAKRDYALLLFYLATGMRRREVAQLRWGDLRINGSIHLAGEVKGGTYREREVDNPAVKDALLAYLEASGRLAGMTTDSPLWTSHDPVNVNPEAPLTTHAIAKRFKGYARKAGIGDFHLHQFRHTFARIVSEETGSIIETQDALDHSDPGTTRVYVQRIAVKRDKHSRDVTRRLGV